MRSLRLAWTVLLGSLLWAGCSGGADDEPADAAGEAEPEAGEVEDVIDVPGEDGRRDDGGREVEADGGGEDGMPEDAAGEEGVSCTRTTNPLTLWREKPEIDLTGAGPWSRIGRLEGPCVVDGYRVVASGGMRVRFDANSEAGSRVTLRLALYDARALSGGSAVPLAEAVGAPGFTAQLEAPAAASGEYLLLVHDLELEDAGSYALSGECRENCGGEATRFPIVLLHGFGGWDTILGFLDYFNGVREELEGRGYRVYAPVADAQNDTPTRAAQYVTQLEAILAETGARKLNLVVHSQGGLDGRYIISTLGWGDRIGALVMVSTPNLGTVVADALIGDLPVSEAVLSAILDTWGAVLGGDEADTRAAFEQLSTTQIAAFNAATPDDPRVQYWSYAGHTCGTLDFSCQSALGGEAVDAMLIITYEFLLGDEPGHGDNDGLVPVASATYGTFLGTIPADHWDEIGQLGDSGPGGPFDHLAFYAGIAARLHDTGL